MGKYPKAKNLHKYFPISREPRLMERKALEEFERQGGMLGAFKALYSPLLSESISSLNLGNRLPSISTWTWEVDLEELSYLQKQYEIKLIERKLGIRYP